MSSREEIGTLIVVVLKARNLNDKHKFRKQDAFAKMSLNGTEKKTKVDIKGGQHPVWDDEVRFPVYTSTAPKFRVAEISVWSKEPRDDDLLGKASLDITKIIETGEFDEWVPLAIDETVRGDVYLEITYYSHGPPPPQPQNTGPKPTLAVPQMMSGTNLQRRPSKMSPSDRLSRPNVNTSHMGPSQGYGQSGHVTPVSPYGRTPPKTHSPLPPLPESQAPPPAKVPPNLLRPGANPTPKPYLNGVGPTSPTRPGMHETTSLPLAQSNPYLTPAYNRHNSTPTTTHPQPNPYLTSTNPPNASNMYTQSPAQLYQQAPTPVPHSYTPAPPASYTPAPPPQQQQPVPPASYTPAPQQQYTLPPSSAPAPSGPPMLWSDHSADSAAAAPGGGFFFPVPKVQGGAPADPYPPGPTWGGGPPPKASSPYDHYGPHHGHRRTESDPRADPALLARYATPLPLPPGVQAERERERREQESRRNLVASPPPTQPPAPSPPPPPKPAPSPPRPPKQQQQEPPTGPSSDRLLMLKRMEEDAARRREQEKKDMELALALDRELNLS